MPDIPPSATRRGADAVFALNIHGSALRGKDTRQVAEIIAAAVLEAAAEPLGEQAAGKILAHLEATEPALRVTLRGDAAVHRNMRRIHYQTAARVAAGAFLTEDDQKRMAAEAFARGDFAACPAPEDDDER